MGVLVVVSEIFLIACAIRRIIKKENLCDHLPKKKKIPLENFEKKQAIKIQR